jgi:hypothetical protein
MSSGFLRGRLLMESGQWRDCDPLPLAFFLMKYKPLPPAEELRVAFAYDPETGVVTRRSTGLRLLRLDSEGYVSVQFKGSKYALHRIIWRIQTGDDPESSQIDHRDRVRSNNAWDNLRLATADQNAQNSTKPPGRSGVRGVQWHSKDRRWHVVIRVGDVKHRFGSYKTVVEAESVARASREKMHGDFTNHGVATYLSFDSVLERTRFDLNKLVATLEHLNEREKYIRGRCDPNTPEALIREAARLRGISWDASRR